MEADITILPWRIRGCRDTGAELTCNIEHEALYADATMYARCTAMTNDMLRLVRPPHSYGSIEAKLCGTMYCTCTYAYSSHTRTRLTYQIYWGCACRAHDSNVNHD